MDKILRELYEIKNESVLSPIPIVYNGNLKGALLPLAKYSTDKEIKLLAKWRKKHQNIFRDDHEITFEGTKKWFKEALLDDPRRILFLVVTDRPIGHIGLYRFNFKKKSVEIDNVIRGEDHQKGIMTLALNALINWTRGYLGIKKIYLQVAYDNSHAISFYEKCGFKTVGETNHRNINHYYMKYL